MLYALLRVLSLVAGGTLATRVNLCKKTPGIIIAFGAGTQISAVAFELILESAKPDMGQGFPAFGIFAWTMKFHFSEASEHWLSFIQAFAGGAILMAPANSMFPEAYEKTESSQASLLYWDSLYRSE